MDHRYPPVEPYDRGMLEVGDGNALYWETSGNPRGKPAVVLHGGPGAGSSPNWRRFFDPAVDLSTNTTTALVTDIERLREHLGVDRWLVLGSSWGTTLGLAYAQAHPARVTELVLFAVGTTTPREVDWITRQMGRIFPEAWARFRDGVPPEERDGDLSAAYNRLLESSDAEVRDRAARDWCAWEDVHVSLGPGWSPNARFDDPVFRTVFARLVTHYWSHAAFLDDGRLLRDADRLAGIPGVLVHGRMDISGPLDVAWELAQRWPDAELVVADEGHGGAGMVGAVVVATDRFRRAEHGK